jgi:alpha-glutamyl/putrescinyl thymine pyrophosphorylase-like protein
LRPRDRELAQQIERGLLAYDRSRRSLPGIHNATKRNIFLEQILESIHRVKFVTALQGRTISELRSDPSSDLFDPLKAAILHQRRAQMDEAFWMVFFFVHFGKHARGGWRYAREVYGRLGEGGRWDWASTSSNVGAFRAWLDARQSDLKREGVPGGFGNHRKYESLDAYSESGTGTAVESYIHWVNPPRSHQQLFERAVQEAGGDRRKTFDYLYRSMAAVIRFGRTARFDYLSMIGKLGLAPIEPGSTYMKGSTGPAQGARLLFGNQAGVTDLDRWLVDLDGQLHVGMQVLEDALCNWQKSPDVLKRFRG